VSQSDLFSSGFSTEARRVPLFSHIRGATQNFGEFDHKGCITVNPSFRGPGSSVGIATGYGVDGPRSNPGGGEIFRGCPNRPWGPPSLLYNGYRVFPGGRKRLGRDADPSPSSSAEV
jgi:hypothetical protein